MTTACVTSSTAAAEHAIVALTAIADGGHFEGEEIQACGEADVMPLVPRPLTSGAKAEGRFGKPDFGYYTADDEYRRFPLEG